MKPKRKFPRRMPPKPVIPKSDWELALEGKDLANVRTYAMDARFALHEALRHDTFGLGVVTTMLAENKIEVLFQNGYKVLIQA